MWCIKRMLLIYRGYTVLGPILPAFFHLWPVIIQDIKEYQVFVIVAIYVCGRLQPFASVFQLEVRRIRASEAEADRGDLFVFCCRWKVEQP